MAWYAHAVHPAHMACLPAHSGAYAPLLSWTPAAAELEQAGADELNFALHRRNGELMAADPRSPGAEVRLAEGSRVQQHVCFACVCTCFE